MGASVRQLDKSGWSPEALARLDLFEASKRATRRYRDAVEAHPLAGVLEQPTDESLACSEAPRWRFKSMDFGNGHREACVWREVPALQDRLDKAIEGDLRALVPRGLGEVEENRKRNSRRAKQKVRHLCKAMGVNSLWTLTYKGNQVDRELALKHLDRFRRRVSAVLGDWRYIAVLEQQERGAWHIHLATHALPVRLERGGVKVKSWNVMRSIWRSVAGEWGGNFDEAKRCSRWGHRATKVDGAGRIAAYIAKYVAKDIEVSQLNRKRYSHSDGIALPEAYRAEFATGVALVELLELAYAAVGDRILGCWFDREREVFYVESDDTKPPH